MTDFKENLIKHYEKYPKIEIEDIFKFIYQAAFGCEHMISSLDVTTEKIKNEYSSDTNINDFCIEYLSDKYCRIPLSYISSGLSYFTLGKLFYLSAKKESNGYKTLEKMLQITTELVKVGVLPFSYDIFTQKIIKWKENGYCPLHHSDMFRSLYHPQYRVISNEYIPFLNLFSKIDTLLGSKKVIMAIEGGSASGKTTLASLLENLYSATVFHLDDFFLTPDMRTKERLSEVGGNVDRERFLNEVLIPLTKEHDICYKPYDCSTKSFKEATTITPNKLVIVEGAYSMHPDLSKYYDFSVFLNISPDKQRERILKRNSLSFADRFFNEWIPMENIYFEKTNIKNRCNLIVYI